MNTTSQPPVNVEPRAVPLAIDVKRFKAILDVGNTKAYELINQGEVESFTIGAKRLVVVRSIESFVERKVKQADAERLSVANAVHSPDRSAHRSTNNSNPKT